MDFRTYAISQKIRRNSDLIKYINSDNIPLSVIEKEFKDVFESYQDNEAELLSKDYKEFLMRCVPVSFTPTSSGLNVDGKIEDTVIEVIEDIHNVKKEEAITDLVTSVVKTVNPTRDFSVKDVSFTEKLERINYQLLKQQENIEVLNDKKLNEVVQHIEVENSIKHVFDKPIEEVVETIKNEPLGVLESLKQNYIDDKKEKQTPIVAENTTGVKEDVISEDITETPKGKELMKEVYNAFMNNAKKYKLDERVSLDSNFSLAR